MKMRSLLYLFLSLVLGAASCKTTPPSSTTIVPYNENLAQYRESLLTFTPAEKEIPTNEEKQETTQVEVSENLTPPTSDIVALNSLLDRLAIQNNNFSAVPGYRIQLYTGADSDKASAVRNKASYILSQYGLRSEMVYEEPLFKVKAGHFVNQLDAQRTLAAIKQHFSQAILVPDKISLKVLRARYQEQKDEE